MVSPLETEVTKMNKVIGFRYEGSVLVISVEPELEEKYAVSDSEEPVRPTGDSFHLLLRESL